MPVTKELVNQVSNYEGQGYSADDIVSAIKVSENPAYKDVIAQIKHFSGQGHDAGTILTAIKNSPSLKQQATSAPAQKSWMDAMKESVSNVPESSMRFIEALTSPIHSPIETAKGLWNLGSGAMQFISPSLLPQGAGNEKYVNAMADLYKQRYGGVENIKQTLSQDPVGMASDLGALLSGGGALAAKVPGLAKAGQMVSTAGKVIEPIGTAKAAIKGIGNIAGPEWLQNKLYASAAKFSTVLSPEERTSQIRTAIAESITPDIKGYQKLKGVVKSLNDDVALIIDDAAKSGATVDATNVIAKVDALKSFYSNAIDAPKYLTALDDIKQTFLNAHGLTIPIDKAQKIKQTTYKLISDSYGELSSVEREAHKAIARGIKDEIYSAFPDLVALNKRESALLALEDAIERASSRIQNWNILGLGKPMSTTAGGALGGRTGAVIGLAASALDMPLVKSRLAFALYKAKKAKLSSDNPMLRIMAYQTGRSIPELSGGDNATD